MSLPVVGSYPVEGSVQLGDVGPEQNVVPHGQGEAVDVGHHAVGTEQGAHTEAYRDGDVLKAAQEIQ